MKIGIFGGCFNPPHKMHINIPKMLIKNKYLDKVIFVPTKDNYNKKDLISIKHRYNMLELLIKNNKTIEIETFDNHNIEFTYQVLDYFKKIYKDDELYFICGSDNLKEFDTWKNYEYILSNYKLLVIKRNNDNIDNLLNKYYKYKDRIVITNIKEEVISSTYIRNLLKDKNNKEILKYIDKSVHEYINNNSLYN